MQPLSWPKAKVSMTPQGFGGCSPSTRRRQRPAQAARGSCWQTQGVQGGQGPPGGDGGRAPAIPLPFFPLLVPFPSCLSSPPPEIFHQRLATFKIPIYGLEFDTKGEQLPLEILLVMMSYVSLQGFAIVSHPSNVSL